MQFPVPQFTDVEDKIIGPLTLKQFLIIFVTGIILFLGFSATKSILVLVFLFVLFGLPGLFLAFGKINGRPVYNAFGFVIKFIQSPKVLVFHKETSRLGGDAKFKNAELKSGREVQVPKTETPETTQQHLKEVYSLLHNTRQQEEQVLRQGNVKSE